MLAVKTFSSSHWPIWRMTLHDLLIYIIIKLETCQSYFFQKRTPMRISKQLISGNIKTAVLFVLWQIYLHEIGAAERSV